MCHLNPLLHQESQEVPLLPSPLTRKRQYVPLLPSPFIRKRQYVPLLPSPLTRKRQYVPLLSSHSPGKAKVVLDQTVYGGDSGCPHDCGGAMTSGGQGPRLMNTPKCTESCTVGTCPAPDANGVLPCRAIMGITSSETRKEGRGNGA